MQENTLKRLMKEGKIEKLSSLTSLEKRGVQFMAYSIYSTGKNKVCFQEVEMSLDECLVH